MFAAARVVDQYLLASMWVHQDFAVIVNDRSHEDFSLEVFLVVMGVAYD